MLIPEQYSNSTGAVCRSLAHLAQKKRDENAEDYDIDFDEQSEKIGIIRIDFDEQSDKIGIIRTIIVTGTWYA